MIGRLAIGAAVALGAFDVARHLTGHSTISEGGSPHGTVTGKILGYRNVIGFGVRHALEPRSLWAAFDAERDARGMESRMFWGGRRIGYDDGPDAFRHTYGSALIAWRLMRDAGRSPGDAVAFARAAGEAHEKDSFLAGRHHDAARAMDLHNNELGFRIAVALASRQGLRPGPGSEQVLAGAVLDAIRGGQAIVLEPSTWRERRSAGVDIAARAAA